MISFACSQCGMKFTVKPELAGRVTTCPVCKTRMVVPMAELPATDPLEPGPIEGMRSSLVRAGVHVGLSLSVPKDVKQSRSIAEALNSSKDQGDRYHIEGLIGRGGAGAVMRAVDRDIRREVAVKFMLDPNDPGKRARFVEEAQITGQLEHPNIVPVHELGIDASNRLFFAMKMVRGRSLADVIDDLQTQPQTAEKQFPLPRLLTIFVQICHALAYAHSRSVIHRDLKPSNIMLGDFGEVYVMDWGIAKVVDLPQRVVGPAGEAANPAPQLDLYKDAQADLTQEGSVMGTPIYMSPEQAMGRIDALDQRSDVYTLGVILYELLTLETPVDSNVGPLDVLIRVTQGQIVPPEARVRGSRRARSIPRELSAIAMKALALEPKQRYQNVEAMRVDVERYQAGLSVSAKEDAAWETLWKFVKRHRGLSTGIGAAMLVMACSLAAIATALVEAKKAHAAYKQSQDDKEQQGRDCVPTFVRAARLAINDRQIDDAFNEVRVALNFSPDDAEARLLRAQLLITRKLYAEADTDLQVCLRQDPDRAHAKRLKTLCASAKPDDAGTLLAFADAFEGNGDWRLADATVAGLGSSSLQARQTLLEVYRKRLTPFGPGAATKLTLANDGRYSLDLRGFRDVADLTPLQGMPLASLSLWDCAKVRDLTPLQGMPLTSLNLTNCVLVRDLTPLQGMPLTELNLNNCGQVPDLTALRGIKLKTLNLSTWRQLRDLSPLQGMPLQDLDLSGCAAFPDLLPLKGMPLKRLILWGCTQLDDLTPLDNMPIRTLDLYGCVQVRDFSTLRSLALTDLSLSHCRQVSDLTPLKGISLTRLSLSDCRQVNDLTPLRGMPLTSLVLRSCVRVDDLTPLKDMRLEFLQLQDCGQVRDLTPLSGMDLRDVIFHPKNIEKGIDILRAMKDLKMIGVEEGKRWPASEFWQRYDAKEFAK